MNSLECILFLEYMFIWKTLTESVVVFQGT